MEMTGPNSFIEHRSRICAAERFIQHVLLKWDCQNFVSRGHLTIMRWGGIS